MFSNYYNFRTKNQVFIFWALKKNASSLNRNRERLPPCFSGFLSSQQPNHTVRGPRKGTSGGTEVRSREGARGAQRSLKLPPRKGDPWRESYCSLLWRGKVTWAVSTCNHIPEVTILRERGPASIQDCVQLVSLGGSALKIN